LPNLVNRVRRLYGRLWPVSVFGLHLCCQLFIICATTLATILSNIVVAGYGLFQGLGALGLLTQHLTVAENVIVQTTAVATATMPLAAGALLLLMLLLAAANSSHGGRRRSLGAVLVPALAVAA
jgi:hypothetical protein